MRTKKVIINTFFSVISHLVIIFAAFAVRKLFVIYADIELLGYESLFGNLFSLFSVSELGIGTIITYKLYEALSKNNEDEIVTLLCIYKYLYRVIAVVVAIMGIICMFFIQYLINDVADINFARGVYLLQLFGVIADYFLSYKRTIFIAQQKQYVCSNIEMIGKIITYVFQIVTIIFLQNYILYLCIKIVSNIIINMFIKIRAGICYPYTKRKVKITVSDVKKRNLFTDVKNLIMHRFSYAIYGGTDNIIISSFCGLRAVAMYGNYFAISSQVQGLLISYVLGPIQASLGNFVYSENDNEHQWKIFQILDVLSFLFATFVSSGFLVFFQPIIILWMGRDFLLPFSYVIMYCMTVYITFDYEIIYKYRCTIGKYELDKNLMVVAAFANIIVSIIGVQIWGITGVQFGTLLALLIIVYSRLMVVMKEIFHKSIWLVVKTHIFRSCFAIGECLLIFYATKNFDVSFTGMFLRMIIWGSILLGMNFLFLLKNQYFWLLLDYIKKALKSIFVRKDKDCEKR